MPLRGMYILLLWDEMFYIHISIKSIWSSVSFKVTVALLKICLENLPIEVSGVLKSPIMIVLLSIFLLKVHQDFLYIFRCSYVWCTYVYKGYNLLFNQSLMYWPSLCLVTAFFFLRSISSYISFSTLAFLFFKFQFAWNILFTFNLYASFVLRLRWHILQN